MSSSEAEGNSEQEQPSITKESIRAAIDELLPTVDLTTTGVKKFRKLLSTKCFGGADLKAFNDFIKEALTEAINNNEDEESEEEEESDDDEIATPTKKIKAKGGYNAPKELSAKLSNFLGGAKEMSRPQIVKSMWEYIKEQDLQNPGDKREILLDDNMRQVFGCDKFTMFTMNKYISAHTHPFNPLDLTPKKKKEGTTSPRSSKKKRKASPGGSATKKRKTGTQPPYRLSDALVNVLQKEILPRPQVVSQLWVYIKANNLQNPEDKREILCDDKLKAVFQGKKKVTMFSMNKFISHHLIEKVDKSEYAAGAAGSDSD